MKITSSTDLFIEDLLNATYASTADARQKTVFKEALRGLVRLSKVEQMHEMRVSLEKLIGDPSLIAMCQRTKSRQRNHATSGRWPQQMEFNQFD